MRNVLRGLFRCRKKMKLIALIGKLLHLCSVYVVTICIAVFHIGCSKNANGSARCRRWGLITPTSDTATERSSTQLYQFLLLLRLLNENTLTPYLIALEQFDSSPRSFIGLMLNDFYSSDIRNHFRIAGKRAGK